VIKDIFRKYPNRYESIIATLCENLDTLDEVGGTAAAEATLAMQPDATVRCPGVVGLPQSSVWWPMRFC
jgi:hypothetical protein